jgi:hypothetical protein
MKTRLIHNPAAFSPGFHHPEHRAIYAHLDTPTTLADCPFPLETETFRVIVFGTSEQAGNGTPGTSRFALVEYVKACGHVAQDRIGFFEGVRDFDHYGKKFTGADYSIENWEARIEYFRNTLCPVCEMFEHCRWAHFHAGERTASRKRTLARFDLLMAANFTNWADFVSRANFEKAIQSPENPSLSLRRKAATPAA